MSVERIKVWEYHRKFQVFTSTKPLRCRRIDTNVTSTGNLRWTNNVLQRIRNNYDWVFFSNEFQRISQTEDFLKTMCCPRGILLTRNSGTAGTETAWKTGCCIDKTFINHDLFVKAYPLLYLRAPIPLHPVFLTNKSKHWFETWNSL